MTILASVKVRDGIALATDSMTQLSKRLSDGNYTVVKNYANARKLFQIQDLPVGVMSWGVGNIGPRSIEGLILDFSRDMEKYITDMKSVKNVAEGLLSFIKEVYDETHKESQIKKRPVLGFFLGGYSSKGQFAEEYEFLLPHKAKVKAVRPPDACGASWRGIIIPFQRLYQGVDPRILQELKSLGVQDDIIKKVFTSGKWNLPFVYDGMPVRDAVNHAKFILHTTIDTATFEAGTAPTCGGPLQVAVILPDYEWLWINKPSLIKVEEG